MRVGAISGAHRPIRSPAIAEAERGRFVLWLPVFMAIGVLAYYALRARAARLDRRQIRHRRLTPAAVWLRRGMGRWPRAALRFCVGFAALGFASAQYATARLPPIRDRPSSPGLDDRDRHAGAGRGDAAERAPHDPRAALLEPDRTSNGRRPKTARLPPVLAATRPRAIVTPPSGQRLTHGQNGTDPALDRRR